MQRRAVTINFPLEVFSILKKSPEDFTAELCLTAAVKWYEMGIISQEKGKKGDMQQKPLKKIFYQNLLTKRKNRI